MTAPQDPREHRLRAVELLALETIGVLDSGDEHRWVREHLDTGCATCAAARDEVAALCQSMLFAADPVEPPARLRDQVTAFTQTARDASPVADPASKAPVPKAPLSGDALRYITALSGDTPFQPTPVDGVRARQLLVDPERDSITLIVEMDAGVSYPRHRHNGDEHCYVLSGDLSVPEDGLELHAGDYQYAPAGSDHGVQTTQAGCTLLLIASLSDILTHQ